MPNVRLFGHYFRTPLLLLFVAEVLLSFVAAYVGWQWGAPEGRNAFISAIAFALVITITMASMGLYLAAIGEGLGSYVLRLGISVFTAMMILAGIFYWLPYLQMDRNVMLVASLLSVGLISINRLFFYRLMDSGTLRRRVVVVGAGAKAKALDDLLNQSTTSTIVGFVPMGEDLGKVDPRRIVENDTGLWPLAQRLRCDEIVIALSERRHVLPMEELLACKARGLPVIDENTFVEKESGKISLELLSTGWLVASDGFRYGAIARVFRRIFDIASASVLLIMTAPLMLLTVVAIVIEDGFSAPVLYRQKRVGENGKIFEVMKFRSMRTDAESDGRARWASANDERITRVGKWIRRSRIDELPQLFNVLKGEMSFVGPRPERPEFVEQLKKSVPFYSERHSVKPGLTGWAQLRYSYGASESDAAQKLQFDLYYIKNHSFFLDLLILVQTVEVVLFGRGAR